MSRIILVNQTSTPDDAGSGNAQLFVEDNKVYKQVGTDSAQEITRGKVLQVVATTKTDTFTTTSTSMVNISGLNASITPSLTSSKILAIVNVSEGSGTGARGFRLLRDSTNVGMGDTAGNRTRALIGAYTGNADAGHSHVSHCGQVLDTPSSTSALTYQLQGQAQSGYTLYINRSESDGDASSIYRASSTITLMEIAG